MEVSKERKRSPPATFSCSVLIRSMVTTTNGAMALLHPAVCKRTSAMHGFVGVHDPPLVQYGVGTTPLHEKVHPACVVIVHTPVVGLQHVPVCARARWATHSASPARIVVGLIVRICTVLLRTSNSRGSG